LKAHHPAEFLAAQLSVYMADEKDRAFYLGECRKMNIPVLPPDVHESEARFTAVEGPDGVMSVRFGLAAIKGVGEGVVRAIIAARNEAPFVDIFDFCTRTGAHGTINRSALESLIAGGALDSIEPNRARLLAVADVALKDAARSRKEASAGQFSMFDDASAGGGVTVGVSMPDVPDLEPAARLAREREVLGAYVSAHPLAHLGEFARALSTHDSMALREFVDDDIQLAGIVTHVTESFAKRSGKRYAKISVSDEAGEIAVICFPEQWEWYSEILSMGSYAVVRGRFDERDRDAESRDLRLLSASSLNMDIVAGEVAVELRLTAQDKADRTLLGGLQEIFGRHEGNVPLLVADMDDRGRASNA